MVVGEWRAVTSLSSVERPPSARAHITSAPSNVSLPRQRERGWTVCPPRWSRQEPGTYGELTNVCNFFSGMLNKQRILRKKICTCKVLILSSVGTLANFCHMCIVHTLYSVKQVKTIPHLGSFLHSTDRRSQCS